MRKIAVEQAERDLEEARESLVEAQGGPTALEFAQAQTTYTKAAADVAALENALQIAQEEYKKAERDLIAYVGGAPVDLKVQRELALSNAEEAFSEAQTRLEQLLSGNPDSQVLAQESTLKGREQALESANQALNAERTRLKDEIEEEIEKYQMDLGELVDELEDELEDVLDEIKRLGTRASDARTEFEEFMEALDIEQDEFNEAMQSEEDVDVSTPSA